MGAEARGRGDGQTSYTSRGQRKALQDKKPKSGKMSGRPDGPPSLLSST